MWVQALCVRVCVYAVCVCAYVCVCVRVFVCKKTNELIKHSKS